MQRTRRRLHAALVELILERGWDRVAVQDVCDRAAIGRSTFYAHYADKEDLLIGGLDDVVDDLRVAAAAPGPRRPFQFLAGLLAHAGASRRLFRAVIGKRSGLAVQRKFRAVLLELVDDELAPLALHAPDRAFAARFLAGALFELLVWWVDARPGVTAARLEHELLRLVEPVLRTAAARAIAQAGARGHKRAMEPRITWMTISLALAATLAAGCHHGPSGHHGPSAHPGTSAHHGTSAHPAPAGSREVLTEAAIAVPIQAGRTAAWEAALHDLVGPRYEEYRTSRTRYGLTSQTTFLQHTPMGDFALIATLVDTVSANRMIVQYPAAARD